MKVETGASHAAKWLVAAVIALGMTSAMAQITGTKHNLSKATPAAGETSQLCVFCHTPHGSDTSAAVPLWNKGLPAGNTYNVYNSAPATATSTIDGEILTSVGSVSIACLSCHDGSQAMDNMINKPGSGGYAASGANLGTLGVMAGIPIPRLGTDLKNDHPIGIQYCGGGITATAGGVAQGTCADSDFIGIAAVTGSFYTGATVKAKLSGTNPVFWVETGALAAGRQKTDLPLYTRTEFAGGVAQPSVECGSCHDPHVASIVTGGEAIQFMRVTTAGSAICLSCHVK